METFVSDISKLEFPKSEKISARTIRPSILDIIRKEHPGFGPDGSCSITELNVYRQKYIAEYLVQEIGEMSFLEDTVLNSMKNRKTLVDKIEESNEQLTPGQRLADKVASFGGSWIFILTFAGFLLFWVLINVFFLSTRPFDPYPFILLNLILSALAAVQAPVIMMSQNRQEEKDRERAKKDYMINLKSELEIRMLRKDRSFDYSSAT